MLQDIFQGYLSSNLIKTYFSLASFYCGVGDVKKSHSRSVESEPMS